MKLIAKAPCCYSRRTCWDTKKYVIDLKAREIITEIEAVRCYRGVERLYEIEVDEEKMSDVVIVEHYVSNRGVNYLRFEIPRTPTPEIVDAVKELLGLREVRKLRII